MNSYTSLSHTQQSPILCLFLLFFSLMDIFLRLWIASLSYWKRNEHTWIFIWIFIWILFLSIYTAIIALKFRRYWKRWFIFSLFYGGIVSIWLFFLKSNQIDVQKVKRVIHPLCERETELLKHLKKIPLNMNISSNEKNNLVVILPRPISILPCLSALNINIFQVTYISKLHFLDFSKAYISFSKTGIDIHQSTFNIHHSYLSHIPWDTVNNLQIENDLTQINNKIINWLFCINYYIMSHSSDLSKPTELLDKHSEYNDTISHTTDQIAEREDYKVYIIYDHPKADVLWVSKLFEIMSGLNSNEVFIDRFRDYRVKNNRQSYNKKHSKIRRKMRSQRFRR